MKKGCLWVIGVFFALSAIGAIINSDGKKSSSSTNKVVAEQNDTDKTLQNEAIESELSALFKKVIEYSTPCDENMNELAKVFQTGDIYNAYEAAKVTKKVCEYSWEQIGKLSPPEGLNEEAHEQAEETLDNCHLAMFTRIQFSEQAMEVANGDTRPSAISEATEKSKQGNEYSTMCAAGFFVISESQGINSDFLSDQLEK